MPHGAVYFSHGRPRQITGLMRAMGNPMATADELRDQIRRWALDKAGSPVGFWTLGRWSEEMGKRPPAMPSKNRGGFIVVAEGTPFNSALAGWDSGRNAIRIYREWEDLLNGAGWWWDALTGWAFQVYPASAQLRESNPSSRIHRLAYDEAVASARKNLDQGIAALSRGQKQAALDSLGDAECDIRQAYTEASYAQRSDAELAQMTGPLQAIYARLRDPMQRLKASL